MTTKLSRKALTSHPFFFCIYATYKSTDRPAILNETVTVIFAIIDIGYFHCNSDTYFNAAILTLLLCGSCNPFINISCNAVKWGFRKSPTVSVRVLNMMRAT